MSSLRTLQDSCALAFYGRIANLVLSQLFGLMPVRDVFPAKRYVLVDCVLRAVLNGINTSSTVLMNQS